MGFGYRLHSAAVQSKHPRGSPSLCGFDSGLEPLTAGGVVVDFQFWYNEFCPNFSSVIFNAIEGRCHYM